MNAMHLRRREFIAVAVGAALSSDGAWSQSAANPRKIGLLSIFSLNTALLWEKALLQGLHVLGWNDGRNLVIERRYAEGRKERLPELVADLIRQKVEVILTTVTLDTTAAKNATTTIPIVMAAVGDPVATGFVNSLARPGGNITGMSQMTPDLSGKRLQLLKEIAPNVSNVAVLFNPDDPLSLLDSKEASRSAQTLGLQVQPFGVRESDELKKSLVEASRLRVGALVILPAPILVENLKMIADYATANRLPSTFHLREFAEVGGLLTYGVDRSDLFRRAASYIDKILKGAHPGDLPIEQPTKFELVVNLKTAKALDLTIPSRVMGLADEVIE